MNEQIATTERKQNHCFYNENSFTAIDFETAQSKRFSICQVGLVRVENHIIVQEQSILVQPPGNYYWDKFIDIHGITPGQTVNAPKFDAFWNQIEPYIKNQLVVAHNGFGFDFLVLNKTLDYYGIEIPEFEKQCTYRIFKKGLASLCSNYGINLNHHDALSDARACAELYKIHLNKINQNG